VSEIEWKDGDGESPALPKEVPLKQELATITPKAMSALHSELLQDPHGIPLGARNWRRSEEEETDNDALVVRASQEAEQRVTKLLATCHGEKWRRQKTSPCYEAIANTRLLAIARLTLTVIRDEGLGLKEAAAAAVTHIEAEDYGRIEESLGGSYEEGIRKFRQSRQDHYVPSTLAERTSSAAPTFCALVNDKVYVNPRRMLKQRALMVDAMYAATPSIDVLDVDEQSASCGQRASH
jgi:hypothetical protein